MMKSTEEMLDYLKVLSGLNQSGFRCEKEIMDVIGLLHDTGFGFTDGKAYRDKRYYELRKLLNIEVGLSGEKYGKKNHGRLIRVTEKERQIGKTSMLISLALFHKTPILVGSDVLVKYTKELVYKNLDSNEAKEVVVLLGTEANIAGRDLPNGVLIDCTVPLKEYEAIKKHVVIRGGFHHDKIFI